MKNKKIKILSFILSLIITFSSCITVSAASHTFANSGSIDTGASSGSTNDHDYKIGTGGCGSWEGGLRWNYKSGNVNWKLEVSDYTGTCKSSLKANSTKWACIQKYNNKQSKWKNFTWEWWFNVANIEHAPGWYDHSDNRLDKNTGYKDTWGGDNYYHHTWVKDSDGVYREGKLKANDLINAAKADGYSYKSNEKWYANSRKKDQLNVVWMGEWTESKTDKINTIVYVEESKPDGSSSVSLNNKNKTAEWLYKNKVTEFNYSGKSLATETRHKKVIKAKIIPVTRKTTYKTNGTKKWSYTYTYTKGSMKNLTDKTITYNVYSPAVTSKQFMPFNLNRNGVATRGDISGPYPTLVANKNLDMSVNNHQNITDNRALQTLDTNNGLKFTVRFNNNQFGIPTKSEGGIDIASEAPCRDYKNANGTYDSEVFNILGSNGQTKTGVFNYTGGRAQNINAQVSKDGYWNLSMKADVSSNNASLTYNGTERVGGNVLSLLTGNRGGDFIFKTTKTGTYNLCGTSASNKWWEARYEGGKFYRYGIQYKGKITTSGIGNPSVVDKNFYTKLSTTTINQPILTGTFEAKTVAGYIE